MSGRRNILGHAGWRRDQQDAWSLQISPARGHKEGAVLPRWATVTLTWALLGRWDFSSYLGRSEESFSLKNSLGTGRECPGRKKSIRLPGTSVRHPAGQQMRQHHCRPHPSPFSLLQGLGIPRGEKIRIHMQQHPCNLSQTSRGVTLLQPCSALALLSCSSGRASQGGKPPTFQLHLNRLFWGSFLAHNAAVSDHLQG